MTFQPNLGDVTRTRNGKTVFYSVVRNSSRTTYTTDYLSMRSISAYSVDVLCEISVEENYN